MKRSPYSLAKALFLAALAVASLSLVMPGTAQAQKPGDKPFTMMGKKPEDGMHRPPPNMGPQGDEEIPMLPLMSGDIYTVTVRGIPFEINYTIFDSFADLPEDITAERMPVQAFTRPEGDTHYYQAVYVPTANVSWVQAAILADSVGGYLASITSPEENAFVFSLVDDEKFFWEFPDNYTPDSHHRIKIGPFLGGTKTDGTEFSDEGWVWLSGEPWGYTNWCKDLGDGVIDKDPRPNDQPNGHGYQNIMGFGELNVPVPYWGDYFQAVSQYDHRDMPAGLNHGFVIEFDQEPTQ